MPFFGNVGTIVSFRVSPEDAPFLEKYFAPHFDASDLIQLANRDFVTTMTIQGEKAPAFSGRTLDVASMPESHLDRIVAHSRKQYAKNRKQVEEEIRLRNSQHTAEQQQPARQKGSAQAQNTQQNQKANRQHAQPNRQNKSKNRHPETKPRGPSCRASSNENAPAG